MSVQCVHVPMLEAKICSRTDIFSDLRLQRSKHGSNCARSSEQQGAGIVFDTRNYCSTKNHVRKYIVKQHVTSLPSPLKGKTKILALPLA